MKTLRANAVSECWWGRWTCCDSDWCGLMSFRMSCNWPFLSWRWTKNQYPNLLPVFCKFLSSSRKKKKRKENQFNAAMILMHPNIRLLCFPAEASEIIELWWPIPPTHLTYIPLKTCGPIPNKSFTSSEASALLWTALGQAASRRADLWSV